MWRKIDKTNIGLQPVVDGKLLKRLFYLSVWSMLHSFISMAPWFLFFVAIEHLGKMELAVSNITRSVSTLFFVIVSSLGTTNSSLVSNLVGAGQRKGVFPICHKIIKMGYAIGLPLVGIALLCNYWIIRFYTNNETLVQHTVPLSSLCCLIMYSQCPDMFTSVLSLEPERQKLPLSFKWLPLWYIFFIFTG